MRTAIGLGDLATAVMVLNVRDDATAQVVRLLGLAPTPERRITTAPRAQAPSRAEASPGAEAPPPAPVSERSSRPSPTATDGARVELVTTSLEPMPIEQPAWPAPVSLPRRSRSRTPLPVNPLFEPRLMPAI